MNPTTPPVVKIKIHLTSLNVRFVAQANDSAGRRRQKTFRLKTVAPVFTSQQMRSTVEAEVRRWAGGLE